jgi:hypothetical protein
MILAVVRHPCRSATRADVGAELVLTLCPRSRHFAASVIWLGEEERRREGSRGEKRERREQTRSGELWSETR